MKKILVLFVLFFTTHFFGQSYPFKISGSIKTEKEKTPVESATIYLETLKDSTVVSYTISNEKGEFSLEGKSFNKNLNLYISFIGFQTYKKRITLSKKNFSLGNINLKEDNLLDEVVIKSQAPITVKKDTLEFNVKSFKTKKDANVEDLLKKLPGVEIDEDGKITVNGKSVNKILVNGKPFFGNDPSITTKNLTKEIIEKVQITDTKSKSEAFSGEKGDANNKTINLTIKKENNKGWFGRVSAGVGTDKRYEAATMINRFDNNQRLSVLASTNNINSPGFSFGEIRKMFGGGSSISMSDNGSFSIGGRSFGGGSGIIKSRTGGATYADEYGKGFNINANYFYSGSNANDASKRNREYTIPDRRYFTNSTSNSDSENDNHSIDLEFDIKIDPTLLINITPNFVYNNRNSFSKHSGESLNTNNELTNKYTRNARSESTVKNFKNEIEITKKLDTVGSFVRVSLENKINQSKAKEYNISEIEIFGNTPSQEKRNQFNDFSNKVNGLESQIKYRYPIIAKKLFLDAIYSYEDNKQENIISTFDFNDATKSYDNFNSTLSSNFTYTDVSKSPGLAIKYRNKKLDFKIGSNYIDRTLSSSDKLRSNESFSKSYNAFVIDSRFSYRFKNKASLYINYNLDFNTPRLNQVQPFVNVSNPSNIIRGNENLKPTNEHNFYIGFNKFNWQKRTGINFYAGGSYFIDNIVTKTSIDDNFVRNTTYTNTDGTYNLWGGGRYSFSYKLNATSKVKVKVGTWFNMNRNISILNDVVNKAVTSSVTPNIGLTYDYNRKLNIETSYRIGFSNTKYNTNNTQNKKFTRHSLGFRTRTNVPKKLEWLNDIRYTFNPNVIGFNQSSWFWNSTLSYSIFKDKASITLKGYDLLNQNTNARRTATENYVEDSESLVLQRYFMLGFSWKFNTLGKKGKTRRGHVLFFD